MNFANEKTVMMQMETSTGPQGKAGKGIVSIDKTAGDGSPGTKDTYTITFTDGSTYEYQVTNGKDGEAGGGGIKEETDPTVPAWAKQPSKPTYTAEEVGADSAGAASSAVGDHNVRKDAHEDIRQLIVDLANRLNGIADSDDATLDQLSEIVAYIKSNKSLIDAITTGKVSTSDIVDNLTTNVGTKVLSAAQGVALKGLIDGVVGQLNEQKEAIDEELDSLNEEIEKLGQSGGGNVAVDATLTKEGMAADAAAVGQRFDDMLVKSTNLITSRWVQGGIDANTGIETTYEGNYRLDEWIAVKPNSAYTFTQWSGYKFAAIYHMWYDADKNFISRTANGPGCPSGVPTTQTSPENAAYLRLYAYSGVSFEALAEIATAPTQLEEGSTGTEYRKGSVFNVDYMPDIPEKLIVWDAPVPDYYMTDNYLPNKVARINELARSVGADGDAFVFVSDMHWEKNAGKSPALLKYLHGKTHIDRLFGGGDYQDNALSIVPPLFECVEALRDAWTGKRYLTLGNHDYMGSEAYALKDKDLYYALNSYGTERVGNLNRNYYYVDNPQTKLRYIVLNRYIDRVPVNNEINGLNEEQRTWLQNDALKVEEGWGVLVFVHDLYRFIYGEDGYTATVSLNYPDSRATVEILDAFVNGGGTVVGIFCGENHVDMVHRTPGGIPVITTTCDKNKSGGEGVPISDQWAERLDGTIHEQAFDVMIVDKANRTIHAVRVGYPARNSVDGAWGEKVEERTITY